MPTPGRKTVRGDGALSLVQQEQAIDMIKAGIAIKDVAERFAVSRNTVIGVWARYGNPGTRGPEPTTLHTRLDALHAKLDRVLAETRNVGRIAEPEREPRR